MRQLLVILTLTLLLPGCYLARQTQNDPLRADQIASLTPGTSTAKDVVTALGAPTEVVQLGRRAAYRYDYTARKDTGVLLLVVGVFNSDTRADRVWVFFDENELLTHVASSLRADDARYALPWQKIRGQ
jgi:outer membrane protein assembly factor BamE (lipoprotein component of BamABCDE complex)